MTRCESEIISSCTLDIKQSNYEVILDCNTKWREIKNKFDACKNDPKCSCYQELDGLGKKFKTACQQITFDTGK